MDFLKTIRLSKPLLLINLILALAYLAVIIFVFPMGNPWLFGFLVGSELFHIWQVIGYLHTVWPRPREHQFTYKFTPPVAVFITICGEPRDIVEETVQAALAMTYPRFHVYLLNDGFVAKRDNWQEAEAIAAKYNITCFTRQTPGGAKAGNINNALHQTSEPYVVIFDADHVPKKHFLQATMGYFIDENVGFVQSPQYYKNEELNQVTGGAWDQQALFFGPLLKGKDTLNAAFMCGTNMVVRREALLEAGGMSEQSIAEDFYTSLLIHKKGWKSVYVDEVLAEGLAPEDFLSYYKQQFRWARGSLELLFGQNPLFRRGLSFSQKFQYITSASYYLSGIVVLINALLPLVYFFTGLEPLSISTMTLALIFLPYIFVIIYTLQLSSNFTYTFRALSFSLSSFTIYIKAFLQTLIRRKNGFAVTSKKRLNGSYGKMAWPHLTFIGLVVIGVGVGVFREGLSAAMISNMAWAGLYIAVFIPYIHAAFEKETPAPAEIKVPQPAPAPSEATAPLDGKVRI